MNIFVYKFVTYLHGFAFTIVIDVNVGEFWFNTCDVFGVTQASLTMNFTITGPGFISVGTYFTTWIGFFRAFWNANTLSRFLNSLANATSSAVDLCTRIDCNKIFN